MAITVNRKTLNAPGVIEGLKKVMMDRGAAQQTAEANQGASPLRGTFDPQEDPLGLALKARGKEHREGYEQQNPQMFQSGPLPDSNWDGWWQAMDEAADGRNMRIAGGASPAGSNQLTGQSVQPSYFTSGDAFTVPGGGPSAGRTLPISRGGAIRPSIAAMKKQRM